MKNAVTNKIRLLRHITPNPCWLKNQRNVLLLKLDSLESGKKPRFAWGNIPVFVLPKFSLKTVLISLLALYLVFGSGLSIIQAAKTSLPGDLLYPVKLVMEDVRIKTSSQDAKPKLQAELVGNRAQELSQIVEETKNPTEKKERVCKALDRLQAQVVSAKTQLNAIKESEPQKVAETAQAVSKTAAESEKALIEAKTKLAEEFQGDESKEVAEAIDAAVKEVRETSILAAGLKDAQGGNEVLMEVQQGEPNVEVLPSIDEASVSFEEIKN